MNGDYEIIDKNEKEKVMGVLTVPQRWARCWRGSLSCRSRPGHDEPVALQMAISRIYETMTKAVEAGPKKKFVAEVRFNDSMGNPIVMALDLGQHAPFVNKMSKRGSVELYEDAPVHKQSIRTDHFLSLQISFSWPALSTIKRPILERFVLKSSIMNAHNASAIDVDSMLHVRRMRRWILHT